MSGPKLNDTLSAEQVRRIFSYDPADGYLRWKTPSYLIKIGRIAGWTQRGGYRKVHVNGNDYAVHRIIWLYVTGEWPEYEIDHIDMNGANNKWENLRIASAIENGRNRTKQSNNKSGYKGVYWHSSAKKWVAEIKAESKKMRLGYYDTPETAHAAYVEASFRLHGDFGRTH